MAWPTKLRSVSFAITFAVVMVECALGGVPFALGLWMGGIAAPDSIARWFIGVSLALSLVIAGQAHVRAPRYSANPRRRIA